MSVQVQPRKKWWHVQWYSDLDSHEERKLILKLDLLFVPYAVLSVSATPNVSFHAATSRLVLTICIVLGKIHRSSQFEYVQESNWHQTPLINTDNAYVAGLKEELGFYGNELVQLQTLYVVGAVVGQLPFLWLFTHVPMHWLIPIMDVAWGVFTLLQYRAHSFAELAAYRFLVGWFEVVNIRRDFWRNY